MKYKNPIIPGYNPDPSICRCGNDFYIVNSTFEFFPGVPIYHSTNLVNWELKGYCLTRRSQLELDGCRNSGGIYAPTIRFHNGRFYMITTNVTDKGHFIVHTDDINSEWSEPFWVNTGGIDPSLFWDDDGKCYFCSTGLLDGVRGITLFEIDPDSGRILSTPKIISKGCGGQCPEGPHIFKRNGYYYLAIAEGGTEYAHRETIQRAKDIYGPFEECPHNPIISHKEYKKSEIQATGHADFTEDENGNWWMVFLGIRRFSHALLHNLGRETFLAPVTWENDWPVIGSNGNGTVELVMDAPLPGKVLPVEQDIHIDFRAPALDKRLFFTRNPETSNYIYKCEEKSLLLKGGPVTINEAGVSPTILSFKQPQFTTTLTAAMMIEETDASRSGVAAYYNNDYHYEIYIGNDESGKYIGFYKHIHDMGVELEHIPVKGKLLKIRIDTDREKYTFSYSVDGAPFEAIGSGLNAGLSTEGTRTMTFTGTLFSIFAENGIGKFIDGIDLIINKDENYKL